MKEIEMNNEYNKDSDEVDTLFENINDEKEPLTCFNYGSNPSREYSYIPNISEEHGDFERERRTKTISWKPYFIKIPIKGQSVEFAVKKASPGEKNFLYNFLTYTLPYKNHGSTL